MQTMDTSPTSAAAVTALLSMRQGNTHVPEPRVCYSTPALDLCIRRRDRTPPSSPECARYLDHIADSTPTTTTRFSSSPFSHKSDSSMSSLETTSSNLFPNAVTTFSTPINARIKPTRPFKAYPKDPMVLALGVSSSEVFLGTESTAEAYTEFRSRMLSQVRGNHGITNKNMRRSSLPTNAPEDPSKSEVYWEKRRKNNEAAKRSRDARRAKEDEIAIRAAFLEHENLKLKYEVAALRKETEKLRCLVYGRN